MKKQVFIVILLIIMFLLGYFWESLFIIEEKDFSVYVEEEQQVFRSNIGKKLYPITYKGILYIPVNKTGSFLNYMTIETENALKLYDLNTESNSKILQDLNTETVNGEKITNDIFSQSDYTILFIMATWCPDCKKEITELENFTSNTKLSYQILTVPIDILDKSSSDSLVKIEEVKKMLQNVKNNSIIFSDKALKKSFVGNAVNIPKLVILDDMGNVIKIIEDAITGESLELMLEKINS